MDSGDDMSDVRLIERDSHVVRFERLLTTGAWSRGALVLVSGPMGVGKSRLLYVLCDRAAEHGATVLAATASENDQAVPLELLDQLYRAAPCSKIRSDVLRLLHKGVFTALWSDMESKIVQESWSQVMRGLWSLSIQLAARAPLVIAIDDVDHADAYSRQFLLDAARRLGRSGILLVLTELASGAPVDARRAATSNPSPTNGVGFDSLPMCTQLRLWRLSAGGVGALLGADTKPEVVDAHYAVTGGNPALLRAVLADTDAHGHADPSRQRDRQPRMPTVDGSFSAAVLHCVHRGGDRVVAAARGIAILGQVSDARPVAALLGAEHATVEHAIRTLEDSGIIDNGAYRHPAARAAVLDGIAPDVAADLRVRAAQLAFDGGAPASVVAEHLVAADHAPESWMLPVLDTAAHSALAKDETQLAIGCHKLALKVSESDAEWHRHNTMLAAIEWRLGAAAVQRRLPQLRVGIAAGYFDDRHLFMAIKLLLWYGRVSDVIAVLGRERGDTGGQEDLVEVAHWFDCDYPDLLTRAGVELLLASSSESWAPGADLRADAAAALRSVVDDGESDFAISRAQRVLESSALDDLMIAPVSWAILTLIYANRLDEANRWCTTLVARANKRDVPGWHALLEATDAEISFRLGNLTQAELAAQAALDRLTPATWGVHIGAPLSSLVRAKTAMGKIHEAAGLLELPVPDEMYESRFGLMYLHARARYHLAANHYFAAASDFESCGRRMIEWNADLPSFIPWRMGLATTCIATNDLDRARSLLEEQSQRPGARHPRIHGAALRLLAATLPLKQRPSVLKESVQLLQHSADQLALKDSLIDLSGVQRALGDASRARMTLRFAVTVAEECGAQPPKGPTERTKPPATNIPPGNGSSPLSDAEHRVAALAARGQTNREIAKALFITPSTVEQHLTRVYRKLSVTGRTQLPAELMHARARTNPSAAPALR